MTLEGDICAYLATQGYGTVGTDIFEWSLPDSPTNAILVIPYTGRPEEHFLGSSDIIEYPCFQVQVRNSITATAASTARAIKTLLDGKTDLSGYISIDSNRSGIDNLGREQFKDGYRHKFAVSFDVTKVK